MKKIQSVVMAISLVGAMSAGADLIQNGGFETPTIFSPNTYAYRTGTGITGWNIFTDGGHNGVVQFNSGYQPVGAGNYSVQLEAGTGDGSLAPDSISQTVVTVPGATYYVSFLLSSWNGNTSSMDVTVDGSANIYTHTYSSMSTIYTPYTFSFQADDNSATLKFENSGAYKTSYPQIDNVSMVPETTTLLAGALLLLPFGASTLRILRQRRTAQV